MLARGAEPPGPPRLVVAAGCLGGGWRGLRPRTPAIGGGRRLSGWRLAWAETPGSRAVGRGSAGRETTGRPTQDKRSATSHWAGDHTYGVVVARGWKPRRRRMGALSVEASTWR